MSITWRLVAPLSMELFKKYSVLRATWRSRHDRFLFKSRNGYPDRFLADLTKAPTPMAPGRGGDLKV